MRVQMLRGTGGPGGIACEAGEVYDLPDLLAQSWVVAGRAVAVDGGVQTSHADPVATVAPPPARKRR